MSFAQILKEVTSEGYRRMAVKVPEWSGVDGLLFPTRLCTEQCSSGQAAHIKAETASRLVLPHKAYIADLTGGIGVDSWAFGQVASRVLHNEMDPAISQAAVHNFALLGSSNVICTRMEIKSSNADAILAEFFEDSPFDARICYLDPARRSKTGSKVFRIEDCSPNVLELLPVILRRSRFVLIKLSPMADIDLCIKEIGNACGKSCLRECICTGVGYECKELLMVIDGEFDGEPRISVIDGTFRLSFTRPEEASAAPLYPSATDPAVNYSGKGLWLFEPGSALAKSGAFRTVSERFNLTKAGRSTQLYWSSREPSAELADAGKWYSVKEIVPFCNENLARFGQTWPKCEVSARNLPVRSEELRKKMKVSSGGEVHIFAFTADFPDGQRRLLAATERLINHQNYII